MSYTHEAIITNVSLSEYWETTVELCESALRLLSVFENQDHDLVDSAITPLRELVNNCPNLEALRFFQSAESLTQTRRTFHFERKDDSMGWIQIPKSAHTGPCQQSSENHLWLYQSLSSKRNATTADQFDWDRKKFNADMEEAICRSKEELMHQTDKYLYAAEASFETVQCDDFSQADVFSSSSSSLIFEDDDDTVCNVYDSSVKAKDEYHLGGWGTSSHDWKTMQEKRPWKPSLSFSCSSGPGVAGGKTLVQADAAFKNAAPQENESEDVASFEEFSGTRPSVENRDKMEGSYEDGFCLDNGDTIHLHGVIDDTQLSALDDQHQDDSVVAFIVPHTEQLDGNDQNLKAIQVCLSNGHSYTVLTKSIRQNEIHASFLGHIMTSPKVTRVVWDLERVEPQLAEILGFDIASSIDLSKSFSSVQLYDIDEIVTEAVRDPDLLRQYHEIEKRYTEKSILESPFDECPLAETTLHYSAIKGWVVNAVYDYARQVRKLKLVDFCVNKDL